MAFNAYGDLADLLFVPQFSRLQAFFSKVSAETGMDITLTRGERGFMMSASGTLTLGERYIHLSWRHLGYWFEKRTHTFNLAERYPLSDEMIALSLAIPATKVER